MKSLVTLAIAIGFFMLCIQNRAYGDSRVSRTRHQVMTLDHAVNAYRLRNGALPPNLAIMTERQPDGGPALLIDNNSIVDPWSQPFHYDPNQLCPESGKPLIWSDGPPGVSNAKIANWGEGSIYRSQFNIPWEAIAVFVGMVVLLVCWVLPRSKNERLRNTQTLAGLLLLCLILGAVCFYFAYGRMLD
ncbi:MAG TPA: type II secretion system protein GspG [Gemmataceae bacterium]|nr:type II secretion system protein GspG [Gemmataceae bacterium]